MTRKDLPDAERQSLDEFLERCCAAGMQGWVLVCPGKPLRGFRERLMAEQAGKAASPDGAYLVEPIPGVPNRQPWKRSM